MATDHARRLPAARLRRASSAATQFLDLGGTGTVYGGVVAEAKRLGVELIPTTYGSVMPGGRVDRAAFDALRDEILAGIRAALPVDGVLLVLHGAMALSRPRRRRRAAPGRVRELVGPDMPIVAPLDLHTNLSDEMVALADAFVGYKEYPHIDMPETGRAGAPDPGRRRSAARPGRRWPTPACR